MTKKKKILSITCGVLAVVVVGSYFALNRNNAVQAMVSTETLQQMDLQNTVSLSGVVESQSGRKVYSTLSYLVEQVNVQVGDVVQQGDVLAQLKTDDLQMDIAQQQAAVNASKNQSAHQIEVSRKAYENAKENYENGLDSGALSAEQGVTSAEYSVEQAQQQLKAAKAAVYDAKENYRVTRDQLEGNVTDAEEALRDAEEALGDAQAAYNDAVAGQESAKKEAAALFEQKTADYKKAAEEWAHLEGTYLADIETEKVNVKDAKDALDNKYPTPPKEGEDGYADYIASDEFKAYQESEGKLRTARETYVQQKSNFQNIQQVYNQAQTDYQNQLASIASSASGAMSGVASAQSGVAAAEAQLDAAQDARNGASMAQLEQGVDSAKRGVDSAQLQKEIAQNQVSNAKDQREASNNAIQQQIDSLKDSLVGSQIAAQSTQSQEIAIQKMQNTLEDATITAPVSGVVTAVYAKVGEPGNGLLFVVEDTQSLKINTKIKEYDVANIREGMPVVIKSDATGDQEISGTVTYIAPAAVKTEAGNTQTGGNDSNVEFEAEVQVNDPNCGLRIGMNTRLTVLLEEKQDVFGVPYDAVVEKADGSTVVYAAVEQQNSGKNSSYVVTEIPVTTGLETDFYIEISGGEVTPGMAVISNPQSVTPGMEVTPDFVANGTTQPTVGLS
ncbi:MAG: HlyD family efflux transporter periplasmic adaptor subunit [Clostridium sp.]|nr:HlyD family efflux transporter periplasmic adaptor subunit [Clostridium sp.]